MLDVDVNCPVFLSLKYFETRSVEALWRGRITSWHFKSGANSLDGGLRGLRAQLAVSCVDGGRVREEKLQLLSLK